MMMGLLESMCALSERIGHPSIVERFVIRNGKEYKEAAKPEKYGPQGMCFMNASEMVTFNPTYTYCEGFGVIEGSIQLPILHAWVVDEEGRVIDPTWKKKAFYVGVEFSQKELWEELNKLEHFGLFGVDIINHKFLFARDPGLKLIAEEIMSRRKEWV